LPVTLFAQLRWGASWIFKFWICKKDYDDEAKLYLIRRNLKLSEEQFQVNFFIFQVKQKNQNF